MKLEEFKTNVKEVTVTGKGITATLTQWGNMEGVNLMVTNDNLSVRMAGAFTWDEITIIATAVVAAQSI